MSADNDSIVKIKIKMVGSEASSLPVVKLKGSTNKLTVRDLKKGVEGTYVLLTPTPNTTNTMGIPVMRRVTRVWCIVFGGFLGSGGVRVRTGVVL